MPPLLVIGVWFNRLHLFHFAWFKFHYTKILQNRRHFGNLVWPNQVWHPSRGLNLPSSSPLCTLHSPRMDPINYPYLTNNIRVNFIYHYKGQYIDYVSKFQAVIVFVVNFHHFHKEYSFSHSLHFEKKNPRKGNFS